MGQLKIQLLGSLEASIDARPITKFDSAKVRGLLAYLATEYQHTHTREKMVGLLWPEMPEKRARKNLSQALYNLRRLTSSQDNPSPIIIAAQQTIQFYSSDGSWVDVHRFQVNIEDCKNHAHRRPETCSWCAKKLEAASLLYRGNFLTGFSLPDNQVFEEWILLTRERLQRQAEFVLRSLTNHHAALNNYPKTIEFVRRQIELDPWRESAHRQLMQFLALDGQRSAALSQYEVCRKSLADELNVEPHSKTTDLLKQIRDGEVIPVPYESPPHNLPAPLTPFVGRDDEIKKLRQCLNESTCRLITLVGVGGSGKTRLALEAAHTELLSYPQGVYLISLAPLQTVSAIIPAMAEALGFTFQESDNPRQQLLDYIHEKSMLLIMDNFEHLLEGVDWVLEMLRSAPELTVLATSRTRLSVKGEHIVFVEGLDFPKRSADLSVIGSSDHFSAIRLFRDAAHRAFPEFDLTPENSLGVAKICQVVQGIPLAILLAASGVGVHTPNEIADQVIKNIDILESEWRDLPTRQRSMRAVLDHSWNMLSKQEQERMQGLSIFRSGFTREAAEQIVGVSPKLLQRLVNKTFLHHASTERFYIHELTRQYASEKLTSNITTEINIRDRHAAFYVATLQQWEATIKKSFIENAFTFLDIESENILDAWDWVTSSEEVHLISQGIEGLCIYYDASVRYLDGQLACQKGVDVLRKNSGNTDILTIVKTQAWLAHFTRQLENFELAQKLLGECFDSIDDSKCKNENFKAVEAFLHLEQGYLTLSSDRKSANHWFQESLKLYQSVGDEWGENQSWRGLARSPLTWAIAVNRARSSQKGSI